MSDPAQTGCGECGSFYKTVVWGAIDFKITQDARQCPVEGPAELSLRQAGRGGEKGGWEHALSSVGSNSDSAEPCDRKS